MQRAASRAARLLCRAHAGDGVAAAAATVATACSKQGLFPAAFSATRAATYSSLAFEGGVLRASRLAGWGGASAGRWPGRLQDAASDWARARLGSSVDRLLGSGYSARLALINAMYAMQPRWGTALSLLAAERLSRGDPRIAWCFSSPVTTGEAAYLEAAERADAEAGAAATASVWRRALRRAGMLLRLLWLLVVFAPVALLAPLAARRDSAWRPAWLRLLRRSLERGGPAFIKWGQWAATRRDLFPPDLAAELEKLHTQAPAHSPAVTEAAVAEAFGFAAADLFYSFEQQPVASGSIGQIHRAQLSETGARLTGMDEGTVVAVKVRHPGVCEAIERDFALMSAAAYVLGKLPWLAHLRLEESLKQFAAPLREQVDLGREAMHLHAFNYNFRGMRDVSFPIPLYPLVHPGVLVETYEDGRHISEYVARGPGSPFNSTLAVIGARTMLHMMLLDAFIHADLHPGNILVRLETPGGVHVARAVDAARFLLSKTGALLGVDLTPPVDWLRRPRMVLLDAGMAMRLSSEDQANMCGLFDAFARLDGDAMARWVLAFSGPEQTCPDPAAFREELAARMDTLRASATLAPGSEANGAEELGAVLDLCRAHAVSLPGHICATVVTTLVLEGWSHDLDPAHSTLQEVKRLLAAKKGGLAALVTTVADMEMLQRVPTFDDPLTTNSWDVSRILAWKP